MEHCMLSYIHKAWSIWFLNFRDLFFSPPSEISSILHSWADKQSFRNEISTFIRENHIICMIKYTYRFTKHRMLCFTFKAYSHEPRYSDPDQENIEIKVSNENISSNNLIASSTILLETEWKSLICKKNILIYQGEQYTVSTLNIEIEMSNWVLDCGAGPLGVGAGRVWA